MRTFDLELLVGVVSRDLHILHGRNPGHQWIEIPSCICDTRTPAPPEWYQALQDVALRIETCILPSLHSQVSTPGLVA